MVRFKQLDGNDTLFFHLDNNRASTGGTMVMVYDQSNRPDGKPLRYKEILAHLEERIEHIPVLKPLSNVCRLMSIIPI